MSLSFPTTRLAALVAVLMFSSSWSPAQAEQKKTEKKPKRVSSKKLLQEATKLARAKKYKKAADRFQRAYEQDQSKNALFGWAQAERMAGNCRQAYFNYARLLQMTPSAKQVEVVQYGMRECEKKLKPKEVQEIRAQIDDLERSQNEEEKEAALARQRTELEKKQRAQREKQRKEIERQRRLREKEKRARENRPSRAPAYILMVAGGVSALAGGGAYFLADDFTKRSASDYAEQLDNNDKAETWELVSTIGFATGGALFTAGAVYLLFVGDGDEEESQRQAFGLTAGPGDIGFGLTGRF